MLQATAFTYWQWSPLADSVLSGQAEQEKSVLGPS
jgi:hypothetical protein